jgi:hypothetical protein
VLLWKKRCVKIFGWREAFRKKKQKIVEAVRSEVAKGVRSVPSTFRKTGEKWGTRVRKWLGQPANACKLENTVELAVALRISRELIHLRGFLSTYLFITSVTSRQIRSL